MQGKSESTLEFLERTDRLASALSITVSELAKVISLSNGMLFAYRTGKNPVSEKAWIKLRAAEHKAGIGVKTPIDPPAPVVSSSVPELRVREAAAILRRQAAELIEAADRIDPSQSAKAREYLANLHRRAVEEEATQSQGFELKKA